jgi:xanthine dehydrogenase small subunit
LLPLDHIRFLRRGKIISYRPTTPTQTVLEYLRLVEKSFGTKEGCNEGDCGACTVALGSLRNGEMRHEPVNACILLTGQLHGKELVTVDDLAEGKKLHPVQQAMVDKHASQCGFCTPGFVMSLFTLYQSGDKPDRQQVVDHIAGNLCRCTGYRSIIDAALASCKGKQTEADKHTISSAAEVLVAIQSSEGVLIPYENGFLAIPSSGSQLAALAATHTDATIVAGATDVGLWITKQMRDLPKIIFTGGVAELHTIREQTDHVSIGAAATYAEAFDALAHIDPDIGEVMRRIGSKQVRASGTIGGNIANGSPIGDMPPMFIAMGAILVLRHGETIRELPLEDFFIAYSKQDRQPGELVWQINVPKLGRDEHFRAYKITKRFDQDISAVMAAIKLSTVNGKISNPRIALGGMAATPKRAVKCEQALSGQSLGEPETWKNLSAALKEDFAPISDMRASAEYRLDVAGSLLRKALFEMAQGRSNETRVTGHRLELA